MRPAAAATRKPRLLVLAVGETVRGDHWGLNGYARQTTPELAKRNVLNFPDVTACGTSTEVSLPCMFSPQGREHYDRDAIRGQGLRPLQVTTQPHVTLAYLDRHLPAQPWLEAVDCAGAAIHVDGFELLFNPGGRYEPLAAWTLSGRTLATPPQQAQLL